MRPATGFITLAGRRALVQFARDLKSVHSFSTSAIKFNNSTAELNQETIKAEPASTEPVAPKAVDKSTIHYLHDNNIISKQVHAAMSSLGFHKLTSVQEKSIEPVLTTESDIVAKAKTGTGKTLAFGIPLIEAALQTPKDYTGVKAVVIAPTRDLAFQIRDELEKIVRYKEVAKHTRNSLRVQTVVGGESRWRQVQAFQRRPIPSIVVATPGRLADLLKEPEVAETFGNLQTLVLDEADRLLGEGFKEDLVAISDTLKEIKQSSPDADENPIKTMLFSATMDKQILTFSKRILRPNFTYIDTVDPNEPETHEKISQSLILTGNIFESYVSAAIFIENEARQNKNFKAIVFLPTVKSVNYFYEILSTHLRQKKFRFPVQQLHGQMNQGARDRSVKTFRTTFSGVLVASDVGARGMDFPKVTNVIQIGLPMDATNYVHRVGRTARGGSTGNAVMILSKAESKFIRVLKSRNLEIAKQFEYESLPEAEAEIAEVSQTTRHKFSLDLVVESLAGFSKGVSGIYKLNTWDILEDLKTAYGRFFNDPERRPHVTYSFATKVLGLNRRDAHEIFDIEARRIVEEDGEGNFDNDRGYNNRRNDRNDRGGYKNSSSRRYSNDRNDRSDRDFQRGGSGRRNFDDSKPRSYNRRSFGRDRD